MEGRGVKPVRLDLSKISIRELNDYLHHGSSTKACE